MRVLLHPTSIKVDRVENFTFLAGCGALCFHVRTGLLGTSRDSSTRCATGPSVAWVLQVVDFRRAFGHPYPDTYVARSITTYCLAPVNHRERKKPSHPTSLMPD